LYHVWTINSGAGEIEDVIGESPIVCSKPR
jgi:hypothetical protein